MPKHHTDHSNTITITNCKTSHQHFECDISKEKFQKRGEIACQQNDQRWKKKTRLKHDTDVSDVTLPKMVCGMAEKKLFYSFLKKGGLGGLPPGLPF